MIEPDPEWIILEYCIEKCTTYKFVSCIINCYKFINTNVIIVQTTSTYIYLYTMRHLSLGSNLKNGARIQNLPGLTYHACGMVWKFGVFSFLNSRKKKEQPRFLMAHLWLCETHFEWESRPDNGETYGRHRWNPIATFFLACSAILVRLHRPHIPPTVIMFFASAIPRRRANAQVYCKLSGRRRQLSKII